MPRAQNVPFRVPKAALTETAFVVGGLGPAGGARPITDNAGELSPVPPPGIFAP